MTTPLGALGRGIVAGIAGAGVQSLFFQASRKITPSPPEDVFEPPEEAQKSEMGTQTVARRFVEGFAQHGPLTERQKKAGGQIVHYAFGGLWGGLYGLGSETWPDWKRPVGAMAFSSAVWMLGDNTVLPLFRLSAWPQRYPAKVHAYALAAHLAYGVGLWATYTSLTAGSLIAGAALSAGRVNRWFGKRFPKAITRRVRPVVRAVTVKPAIRSAGEVWQVAP